MALARVLAGRSADRALGELLEPPGEGPERARGIGPPPAANRIADRAADRALTRELCLGALRWAPRLRALLPGLLHRPLPPREGLLEALLLVGLHQLLHLRIPDHAAVAATVEAARLLGRPRAAPLVNAVLRAAQRRRAALEAAWRDPAAPPELRWAHPAWLVEALRRGRPQAWEAILEAGNRPAPMTLRVHRGRLDREAYRARLAEGGLAARPCRHAPEGLVLERPVPVEGLPGFAEGLVSVQDEAAQLAAGLLLPEGRPARGLRVLDACAAPGGKAAHLLEGRPGLELVAVERDPGRLERLRGTLARLGLEARLVLGDAAEPGGWWDGRPFHRILLDAPCSGTGVIRRHPDIKLLRRPEDVAALVRAQARLLEALWPLLAPGGRLLYATCSVLPEEDEEVVSAFLARHPEARALPLPVSPQAPWGRPAGPGRLILPGEEGMDGFYYALLAKEGPGRGR
ncbi:MAG: 16S rRNA (cytosine(967)-C(5))-methyltransferase RsmB [Gammaproteobacteria bacterium]|nr:MAG: 16S rRNA (cytosine(967)-C(5))-methyltransferase RsmB [Gammaproteobacteria bacterium]